jgi:hypothetical protein
MQRGSKVPSIAKRSSLSGAQVNTNTHTPVPLAAIANNTDGTGMRLAESAISSSGLSAFVNSFVDKFVALLPTAHFGDSDGILNNAAPVNPTDGTPLLRRSLFNDGKEEMMLFAMGTVNKLAAPGVNIASFPVVLNASCI